MYSTNDDGYSYDDIMGDAMFDHHMVQEAEVSRKNYIDCLKEFIDVIDWETDHLEGTMKIDAEIAKVTKDLLEKMHSLQKYCERLCDSLETRDFIDIDELEKDLRGE